MASCSFATMETHDATLLWGDPAVSGLPSGGLALPIGTVTFLLTDVEGSTHAWEAAPDAMAAAIARHYDLLDAAITAHGGVRPEEQGEGDSVVAAFSRASDAVLAALDAQRFLTAEHWPTPAPLRVRMAIHTGEARLRDEGNYVGQAIIRTARLRAVAHGGQVLVSSATHDLAIDQLGTEVELVDRGRHRLKDLARPEQVYQLAHPDLADAFPPLMSLDAVPNNLPLELSTFVGRLDEIATISRLVRSNRLVTLTGTGGAGKTRLAQQVAADVLSDFADGAWWVELVGVTDPAQIAPSIATALGEATGLADPLQLLAKRLADRRLLVVLDNCEHLVEPIADVVHTLVSSCAHLSILTTSRSALNLPGELTWRVPPLGMPDASAAVPIEALAQYDAVQLFLDRAVRARQNFRLVDDNAADVAAICHRLDGIPLAIELAAARCKVLSPAQIREGLDNALGLLGSGSTRVVRPRQQTIEASINWSYSLLPDAERCLLRRLAAFVSPFSLDAAEAIAPDENLERAQVLDVLERLVDQSLVQMIEVRAETRFRLLETVRQFGRRELHAAGETEQVEQRHAAWFAERASGLWPLYHSRMIEFLDLADAEHDDMMVALEWMMSRGTADQLCRMAVGLLPTIGVRHVRHAATWFDRVIDHVGESTLPVYGELLVRRAEIALFAGMIDQTFSDLGRAETIGRAIDDEALLVSELGVRLPLVVIGDPIGSLPLIEEFGRRAADVGDLHAVSEAAIYRAMAATSVGDVVGSCGLWTDAITSIERTGCRRCLPLAQSYLAIVMVRAGELDGARRAVDAARRSAVALDEGFTNALVSSGALDLAIAVGESGTEMESAKVLLAALNEQGDRFAMEVLLPSYGLAVLVSGDHGGAREVLVPLMDSMMAAADSAGSAALVELAVGDLVAAATTARRGLELIDASPDEYQRCRFQLVTSTVARLELRIDDATDAAHQALDLATAKGYQLLAILALESLGTIAVAAGDTTAASRLAGAVHRRRSEVGFTFRLPGEPPVASLDHNGEAEGRTMSWDDAVAFTRRMRGERKRPLFGWDALTPTELQVVAGVVEGLTNPQIAAKLLMGRETVKTHLSSVYSKVSVTNRSQLAVAASTREGR